eukprot:CAMPEP_0202915788 /NCGR_PEP_ID=MMETSP1392-20130828/66677_1 /ASSEMBLY_ACC=CAM_ASM_000868 /TAXON_ID=225041 /ORGANISM="Chlamydomonas chlamydogama, Strain SAG 11-48b" /LENGTH=218 /DNA_ID=CAMNT_0049607963 /DNA_START=61 /DNA_END=714 /DNA_ORIENTATION=+
MLRSVQAIQAVRLSLLAQNCNQLSGVFSHGFATAVLPTRATGDVPPGHMSSDLSPNVCNIGLGRRRDLTLRQDLCLWKDGSKVALTEIFKGKKVILVGFPGGPICTEKHLPGYVQLADQLSKKGVDKVVAVTVDSPENVSALSSKSNLQSSKVELIADKNGGLTRLLGVEIGLPESTSEPRCQRYAGIVEDGILLKLKVEKSPAELAVSDAASMMKLW